MNLSGQIVLLTGGTSGIGRVAARRLADLGATVVITGRNRDRGERILDEIERETTGSGRLLCADFADQSAVQELAKQFRTRFDRLDVLVHNAGTYRHQRELIDGVEATFAINHLAPYLLTHKLADRLVQSAPARVVVTSSGLHSSGTLNLNDLAFENRFTPEAAYARSKLANVLFTFELADRLDGTGVTANTFHPGTIPGTRLSRNSPLHRRLFFRVMASLPGYRTSVEKGAERIVHLAGSPEVADLSGRYFVDMKPTEPAPEAADEKLRERLWETSADLVGVDPRLSISKSVT
jgi:NAD(P)-dependent dehydrogenase (short-subunit alcohol dehydrogenase family)